MQISLENISNLERRMTIEVPREQILLEKRILMKNFSKKAKISGFRPGKIAKHYLEKQYGLKLYKEAITNILHTSLKKALQEQKLQPINNCKVENLKDDVNLVYTVIFEVYPKINLNIKIQLEQSIPDIIEEDIDFEIKQLQNKFAIWNDVTNRVAKNGDKITIDFVGKIDGCDFQGGSKKDFDLELGSGTFINGFEQGMFGAKINETRILDLNFPKDYENKKIAGKNVLFTVKVQKIKEKQIAPIDSNFAQKIGMENKDISKIRDKIKENMMQYIENINENKMHKQVLEKLYEVNKFDIPKSLVDKELYYMLHETYGKNSDIEKLTKDKSQKLLNDAKKKVAIRLILYEIVKTNNLQPEQEKIIKKMQLMASVYGYTIDKVKKMYDQSKDFQQNIIDMVITDQAIAFVLKSARIIEKKVRFYDIINVLN